MRTMIAVLVMLAVLAGGNIAMAQEMTQDEYKAAYDKAVSSKQSLTEQLNALNTEIATKTADLEKLNADYTKNLDELYALVGSDATKAAAFSSQISALESKANELSRLSDAELAARAGEVTALTSDISKMWDDKLALIPENWDRLTALTNQAKSLQTALAGQVKVYTVGTWARDRDCLWNIAKKKDIYDNAWLWPKIWQGNRDQIRDPDIIEPGWKLKIPQGTSLTSEEKSAAAKYYRGK